ncbi:hypothetical protein HKD37_04G010555 [Glycine soja]
MKSTLLREETILIINTPIISVKDRASDIIKECLGINPCVATYPSAGGRCEGSWVRLPREAGTRSHHQR